MDSIKLFIAAVASDPVTNWAIIALLALPLIDWLLGTLRALRDSTYVAQALDVFVRTKFGGRTVPLIILLILGRTVAVGAPTELTIPGLDLSIITGAGILAAAPYLVVTAKSIIENATADTSQPQKNPTPQE